MPKRKLAASAQKETKSNKRTKLKEEKIDIKSKNTKKKPKSYTKKVKESSDVTEEHVMIYDKPLPHRNKERKLQFDDWKEFQPNLTPAEVLQAGSFGGTYYRPIKSSITGKSYSGVWKELPKVWLDGLDIPKQVASSAYCEDVNTYRVKCGGSLEMWEQSGWMHPQDPYGWFQWYCRFYQGRRTEDDERQIGRWLRCAGEKGRWRNNLITKCAQSKRGFDDHTVSPVVRQTLQHWAYRLTKEDYEKYVKKKKL